MKNFTILFVSFLLLFSSCENETENTTSSKQINYYHWKSNAVMTNTITETLKVSNTQKIYMHYFDVDKLSNSDWDYHNNIYPTYVLKNVENQYKEYEIVPVVYIVNDIFKQDDLKIDVLVEDITKLINQISEKQFNQQIKTIQIDCDWSESTRNQYFSFLTQMKQAFDISITFRLHQIKFPEMTGVPPVTKGTLMLYNMGDLRNKNQNSIIENSIVQDYITSQTTYPISMDVALPLFSQTVISNNKNEIKIIKNSERKVLETDHHFKAIDQNNFSVVKDTLFRGFYLKEGFNLKLEELAIPEIVNSYQTIKDSKLQIGEIILYHLDDECLENISVKNLIEQL